MNKRTLSAILSGEYGHNAAGSTLLSVHNFAAFNVKSAVFAALKKTEIPLYDDSALAAFAGAVAERGENHGIAKVSPVDGLQMARMLAASFVLLARHCLAVDPETGKRADGLRKYLRNIDAVKTDAVTWASTGADEAIQIRAKCEMLKVSPDASLTALRDRKEKEFTTHFAPFTVEFAEALKLAANAEDSTLIDDCAETLTDAGKDPWQFACDAACANMDRQRERASKGLYTVVDAGVHALAAFGVSPIRKAKPTA